MAISLQDICPAVIQHTRRRTISGHLIRATIFAALAAFLLIVLTPRDTGFDGPMHLAARLWHGEISFPEKDAASWWETFHRGDRFYLVYAPMASVLLMPYVAAGGAKLGMPFANTLFLLASTVVLWFLMRSDRRLRRSADVAAAAYLLATPLMHSVAFGSVWLLIHSEGNLFLLSALLLLRRRHYGWAGFALAVAICTRNALLFTLPFLPVMLWRGGKRPLPDRLRRMGDQLYKMAIGAAAPVALSFLLTWGMTGSPLLTTYQITYDQWQTRDLYSVKHFLPNLRFYFLEMPRLGRTPPFLQFPHWGQAFWVMSPFFLQLGVLYPRTRFLRAALVGAICGFVPYLFFLWNGSSQVGSRYMSDLYPFLIPLTFSGVSCRRGWWNPRLRTPIMFLILLSLFLNGIAAFLTRTDRLHW